MGHPIRIQIEDEAFTGELDDNETARALLGRLPLDLGLNRWGDEYYGSVGDELGVGVAADARDVLEVGELAYWPPGNAFCLFFGPTPVSADEEPRAASAVNPIGRIHGDLARLARLGDFVIVRLEVDASA